jgi:hypothetical protein
MSAKVAESRAGNVFGLATITDFDHGRRDAGGERHGFGDGGTPELLLCARNYVGHAEKISVLAEASKRPNP